MTVRSAPCSHSRGGPATGTGRPTAHARSRPASRTRRGPSTHRQGRVPRITGWSDSAQAPRIRRRGPIPPSSSRTPRGSTCSTIPDGRHPLGMPRHVVHRGNRRRRRKALCAGGSGASARSSRAQSLRSGGEGEPVERRRRVRAAGRSGPPPVGVGLRARRIATP